MKVCCFHFWPFMPWCTICYVTRALGLSVTAPLLLGGHFTCVLANPQALGLCTQQSPCSEGDFTCVLAISPEPWACLHDNPLLLCEDCTCALVTVSEPWACNHDGPSALVSGLHLCALAIAPEPWDCAHNHSLLVGGTISQHPCYRTRALGLSMRQLRSSTHHCDNPLPTESAILTPYV